jgi:BirA family biotin operon repressor/biotin-[acetyl-CoA-carboxylase] ligase
MSVAYSFKSQPSNLPALTLAVGATLADELAILGVKNIGLKWPNDLVVGRCKLGGILLESCDGGMTAVAGIGINMALPPEANDRIRAGKKPIDLGSILAKPPSVVRLAARVIERLHSTMHQFDAGGLESFVAGWSRFDTLAGLEIVVRSGDVEETGTAQGIADDGALLIENKQGVKRIVTGTVRVVDGEEATA